MRCRVLKLTIMPAQCILRSVASSLHCGVRKGLIESLSTINDAYTALTRSNLVWTIAERRCGTFDAVPETCTCVVRLEKQLFEPDQFGNCARLKTCSERLSCVCMKEEKCLSENKHSIE